MTGAHLNRAGRKLSRIRLAALRVLDVYPHQTANDVARRIHRPVAQVRILLDSLYLINLIDTDCGEPERWRLLPVGEQAIAEELRK